MSTALSISPNIELINNSWLHADCATVLACVQCKSIMPYCLLMNEILRDFLLDNSHVNFTLFQAASYYEKAISHNCSQAMYNLAVLQMKGLVRERTDSTKLLIQAAKLNHTKVSISNQYVYITHYDNIQQLCILPRNQQSFCCDSRPQLWRRSKPEKLSLDEFEYFIEQTTSFIILGAKRSVISK